MANTRMKYGPNADGMNTGQIHVRKFALLVLVIGLAGCAAGPDFKRPAAPDVADYTDTPIPTQTESAATRLGEAQRIVTGMPVDIRWWRSLESPRLDALIEQALQASPTLAAATAMLRQAQVSYAAQAGSTLYPQVDT